MAGQGPPYPPAVWALGGSPKKSIDIPTQSVFLFLFAIGAAAHMTIFQKNRARSHKFLPNLFCFAFCMARIATSVLRIASVSLPQDLQLAIAAQIFVAAGVLIIFVINIVFAMRLVRSMHSSVGWHPIFSAVFKIIYALIGATLVIVITATVQTFYTLSTNTRSIDRALQLYGSTFLAIIATLPLPMVLLSLLIPHSSHDHFGAGRLRTKITVLLVGTILLSFGAWYRCGVAWQTPIPRSRPLPGYMGKAPFYVVNFAVEILTVYLYAIMRIDRRWHVPNGAKGPGSYSGSQQMDDVEMQGSRTKDFNAKEDMSEPRDEGEREDNGTMPADKEVNVEKAEQQRPPI
ncbi:Nn.00g116150.m01.CDS01 [Neocucurbitaria sp. VM-36]